MILFLLSIAIFSQDLHLETLLYQPQTIKAMPNGRLLLPDAGEKAVFVLEPDGSLALRIGREGQGPGEFDAPTDADSLSDGRIVVADGGSGRIQFFSPTGEYQSTFNIASHSVGQLLTLADDSLLITETNGLSFRMRFGDEEKERHRFYVYDQQGELQRAFGTWIEHENPLLMMRQNNGPIDTLGDDLFWANVMDNQVIRYGDGEEAIRYPLNFAPVEPDSQQVASTDGAGRTTIRMRMTADTVCLGMAMQPNGEIVLIRAVAHTDPDSQETMGELVRLSPQGKVVQVYTPRFAARALTLSPAGDHAYVLHERDDWVITRVAL